MPRRVTCAAALLAACAAHHPPPDDAAAVAEHGAHDVRTRTGPPFIASSATGFQASMDEAMARMHAGMEGAPRSGDPDRDFVTQMIPHHQGAIDMAKVLLVHGKDAGLQRLAKEIMTDQQSEIDLMRAWLDAHPAPPSTEEHP
ncbi:MAG: DUF305 domain-containing protein [Anaeromyxobacteraceae bacterium]